MRVTATTEAAASTAADTIVVGLVEGEGVPHDVDGGALQALVDAGEAKTKPCHLAVAHAAGKRWILVGLGSRDELSAEGLRLAAAAAHGRARELGTRVAVLGAAAQGARASAGAGGRRGHAAGGLPLHGVQAGADDGDDEAGCVRADRLRPRRPAAAVARAVVVAEAVNAARDLQNTPANHMTPTALGARAQAIAAEHDALSVRGRRPRADRGARDGRLRRGRRRAPTRSPR